MKKSQQEEKMDFLIDSFIDDDFLIGNNGNIDIPIGTIFTKLTKVKVVGYGAEIRSIDMGLIADVRLELKQVLFWRKNFEYVPRGHAAALLLEGDINTLKEAMEQSENREYLHLIV